MAAKLYFTANKGVNWTSVTGPFASGEDVLSSVCFAVSKGTSRWLVARGTQSSPTDPTEVAYSDDSGTTWTNVDAESGGARFASDSGALFAMDRRHIWLVATDGYIYFSEDGGESWVTQSAGTLTTEDLNQVHFADTENGMAVGAAGIVLKTGDGGVTWTAATPITSTPDVCTVQMLDSNMAVVGTNDGKIYMTFNGGTTWVQKYSLASGVVNSIHAVNKYVMWGVVDASGGVGSAIRSRNGGYTWESVTTPTNAGLNSVRGLDANKAWCVGVAGKVIKIYG